MPTVKRTARTEPAESIIQAHACDAVSNHYSQRQRRRWVPFAQEKCTPTVLLTQQRWLVAPARNTIAALVYED